jgi:hypothetical protein
VGCCTSSRRSHWYLPNEHPVWSLRRAELIDFSEHGCSHPSGSASSARGRRIT